MGSKAIQELKATKRKMVAMRGKIPRPLPAPMTLSINPSSASTMVSRIPCSLPGTIFILDAPTTKRRIRNPEVTSEERMVLVRTKLLPPWSVSPAWSPKICWGGRWTSGVDSRLSELRNAAPMAPVMKPANANAKRTIATRTSIPLAPPEMATPTIPPWVRSVGRPSAASPSGRARRRQPSSPVRFLRL